MTGRERQREGCQGHGREGERPVRKMVGKASKREGGGKKWEIPDRMQDHLSGRFITFS